MNTKAVPGLQVIGGYFTELIGHHLSAAGCNDMPDELFRVLTPQQKQDLLDDFNEYDQKANPDGWEPRTRVEYIPDFALAAYFMRRAIDGLSESK